MCFCVFSFRFFCVCMSFIPVFALSKECGIQPFYGRWLIRAKCLFALHSRDHVRFELAPCMAIRPHYTHRQTSPIPMPVHHVCYSRYLRSIHTYVRLREQKPEQRVPLPNPCARVLGLIFIHNKFNFICSICKILLSIRSVVNRFDSFCAVCLFFILN